MIKLTYIATRAAQLDVATFQAYWLEQHAPLVAALPGLRRYVQSHTLPGGYRKGEPVADGIAELWFEDVQSLRALTNTKELAAVRADESNFLRSAEAPAICLDEHVIKDGPVPAKGVKNIEFVRRKAGMPVAEFQRYWREVHGPLGASIKTVQRYVQNHATARSYTDGKQPLLDGFALTWFEDTDAMRASAMSDEYRTTREDEDNFLTVPLDFIITREHIVLAR